MKFVWTPLNVLVLALRFLLLTIPHWIRCGVWFLAKAAPSEAHVR